jgi:fucose 4-O-acetylase-like acetyltransferase
MKKIYTYTVPFFVTMLLVAPLLAGAQSNVFLGGANGGGGQLGSAMGNILAFISNVLIPFILAIGFFVFVWGIFNYFIIGGANDDAKEKGKSLIIYALAGFVVILAFWGIVNIFVSGVGLQNESLDFVPKVKVGS